MPDNYEIRLCTNPTCGLRYPLVAGHSFGERCPRCLGPTSAILTRSLDIEPHNAPQAAPRPLGGLLDNLRSAWNVGAIFRTADCLGVREIHLCGITATPENSTVSKTALGADFTIPWTYSPDSLPRARSLIEAGVRLWALEQADRAIPLDQAKITGNQPLVLVAGNEVTGVDPGLLELCEQVVYIPMLGKKRSLNVEVAFGIAAQALISAWRD